MIMSGGKNWNYVFYKLFHQPKTALSKHEDFAYQYRKHQYLQQESLNPQQEETIKILCETDKECQNDDIANRFVLTIFSPGGRGAYPKACILLD